MKKMLLICYFIVAATTIGCEKSAENERKSLSDNELEKRLSDAEQLHVIEQWQTFRKEAGTSLLVAQEKLQRLEQKMATKEYQDNETLKRRYHAANRQLEKLTEKLLRHGIIFKNTVGHYRVKDLLKNENFCTGFRVKLSNLHAQIDAALAL